MLKNVKLKKKKIQEKGISMTVHASTESEGHGFDPLLWNSDVTCCAAKKKKKEKKKPG